MSQSTVESSSWHIAHDFAFSFGGAERVTKVMGDALPEARATVLGGDPAVVRAMQLRDPATVFPRVNERNYRALTLVLPKLLSRRPAIEGNLLASSYAYCHLLAAEGRKVVYCHSPLRQVWSGREMYRRTMPSPARPVFDLASRSFRRQDIAAARGADLYIANSRAVQQRVSEFYGIGDVPLLAPPVEGRYFYPSDAPRGDYFLFAGRIVEPYKRVSLLIEAFREIDAQVIVAGDGRERAELEAKAPANVKFIGQVDSERLGDLYRGAQALLFPSEDDFGMTPAESIACGTPVIAYRGGGALDTVQDGASGVFFDEPTVNSMRDAVARFRRRDWERSDVLAASRVHDEVGFARDLLELLARV